MLLPLTQLLVGFLISLAIGLVAYRRQSLSRDGVLGALLVGTLTFGLGGLSWAMVVVAFFVSSSFLTHYRADQKHDAAAEFAKGGARDFWQVLANGAVAVLLAVLVAVFPQYDHLIFAAFVGAMAAAAADTWATELGLLSTNKPRLITTWQIARRGESGAVSALGLTAAATGALLIGSVALIGKVVEAFIGDVFVRSLTWLPATALIAGWLGSVVDSLLGATLQAMYYCAPDDALTEQTIHSCGRPTIHTRGLPWLNNDGVNFLASLAGAIIGAIVFVGIGR
ncbi:MAG: DUF92 domain-containing protein [Chloroflexota bacterium]